MHPTQQKLVELAQRVNIGQLTLRETGQRIGLEGSGSAQLVKHHLAQLLRLGFLEQRQSKDGLVVIQPVGKQRLLGNAQLLSIPILGSANAGPATMFATEHIEGYLKVSSSLIDSKRRGHKLFSLRVSGSSMNNSRVSGKTIEDGDYVIVDADERSNPDGQVVLSVIDGVANLKRFRNDLVHRQILLVSESTEKFPPIAIHPDDSYMINGIVIQVIKHHRE